MLFGWPLPLAIFVGGLVVSILWLILGMILGRLLIMPLMIVPIEEKLVRRPRLRDAVGDFLTCLLLGPLGWIIYATAKLRGEA